ncbi:MULTISPECIES: flagellar motor switch protein FliM [unclassified Limnohabitans]|jgi:flagellar motor switch protein FliM|uniref:flagellar motor switch protein FliM n=1 Tax=unclassified Limnohabitans TaxID=2626134 RepID=UPI0006DC5402|nr:MULTISPECIES: flagellar motor switch protein FliM [unclassified Limnohabitans]ALK90970.1 Flagellar motor switch protein FliM [Limnohabitans sp. 103DPR2]MBU3723260.1 flagellar motor switch protein FliM [Limnohabitans sp.]PUE35442.1 flagellar motor switch protein FliM [Limnohabitans sp. Hippo4]
MATSLLTPDELSALAEGVMDGSIPVDTGFNTAARVKKHDLASEDSSLGVNITSIDMINERFIRTFRLGLVEMLRTSPKVNPNQVEIVRFGDYLKSLKAPLSVNVVRMNPLRGNSIVVIDPTVVFSSLDSFFGGFGKGVGNLPPGRLFTPTESRIINMILEVFFKSLKDAWSAVLPVDFELVSSEINPQFAQIADENDLVILTRFEAEGNMDAQGFIDLVYPYASLKPIRELLRSRVQSGDGNDESDKQWREELEEAVDSASLEARVLLGSIESSFGEIEAMKEGDVLFFKKPDLARLLVNGLPAFDVQVGTIGAQTAVQIERACIPGMQ